MDRYTQELNAGEISEVPDPQGLWVFYSDAKVAIDAAAAAERGRIAALIAANGLTLETLEYLETIRQAGSV